MQPEDNPKLHKEGSEPAAIPLEHEEVTSDDPFANIGQEQTEVEETQPVSESKTSIPVDFGTPSLHIGEGGEEGGDMFDRLGAEQAEAPKHGHAAGAEEEEPIQMVEQAANDLFDSLGVQHDEVDQAEAQDILREEEQDQGEEAKTDVPNSEADGGSVAAEEPSVQTDMVEEQDATTPTPTPAMVASADSIEPTSGDMEVAQGRDVAAEGDEGESYPVAQAAPELPEPSTRLGDAENQDEDEDDVFATIGSGGAKESDFPVQQVGESSPADLPQQPAQIDLVETEADSIFDNLGSSDTQEPDQDSLEEQERKYQLLLEEFGGEMGEDGTIAPAAADLFGQEADSTPFDDLIPSSEAEPEYLQTASSSTTPPNLSIENSLQDIEPYDRYGDEGEVSILAESSDWPGDGSLDEQSYLGQEGQGDSQVGQDSASSPMDFEVPYGWYEGDTFHYYTEEQREQVRLAMMEQAPEIPEPQQSAAPDQGWDTVSSYAPVTHAPMSENAARRTPNPDQYTDTYTPSTSRDPMTSASTYYGESQYTASSATTDPYAPTSSSASPAQAFNPYAPATPAAAPYDPYAQVYPAKVSPYASLGKQSPALKKVERPTPPQRVASTAYDPPFLRPQKSFIRPASAASVASTSYGVPPMPVVQAPPLAPTPPAAPPPGPPRRSTTPYAPPPQPREPMRQPTPVQSTPYAPAPAPAQTEYVPEPEREPVQVAPPAGPPRGPPSRPASSMASARQAQRAPSYNAFDPPLRAQTSSRASTRAPAALPQQQASPTPAFALSPPTESTSQFGSRPPSRAAPAFEAPPPPPVGPPKRATSSFQPPPRPPSVSQPMPEMDMPRPASRTESQYGRPHFSSEGRSDNERSQVPVEQTMKLPQLHSGQEEPDEEGGAWDGDEEVLDDRNEIEDHSVYPSRGQAEPPVRPPSAYGRSPQTDSYQPLTSDEPPQARPFTQSPYSPIHSSEPSYQVYEPSSYANQDMKTGLSQPLYGTQQSDYSAVQPDSQFPRSNHDDNTSRQASYDPYAPSSNAPSARHDNNPQVSYDPYAPTHVSPRGPSADMPSSLGLSSLGPHMPHAQNAYDSPYTPARPADQYTPGPETHLRVASPNYGTDYGTSPPANNYFAMSGPADQTYTPQQVLEQRPVSEDPLGRSTMAARNAPIAVFGFGGVLITAFPGVANADHETLGHSRTASYGYASGRGQLWVRSVSDLVSESALKSSETVFPGPLVLDPSSARGSAGDKKKKEAVLKYLKARSEEIEKGLPYLKTSANATRREQEGKLALLRVLVAMIIGEGKLSGSTQVEDAIREALQNPSGPSTSTTFSPSSATSPPGNTFTSPLYQGANHNAPSAAATPAQLGQLSTMLANGDKRDAALFAANNGLWSHALLISSSVDQEFWRDIVSRFAIAELHAGVAGSAALKASYTLFGGAGPTAVDDLFSAAHISDDPSADQWREVIGAVVFNGKPADVSHLDDLGTRLTSAGLVNAGHVCSLLSPSSAFGDLTPGALERPISLVHNARDEDAVIFAEIAEYARSLIPIPKGQELPFPGLPQLLPYKLHRAWWAAELGDHELARRYCTAVESASKVGKNGPTLLSRPFLNSLEDLQERLTGEPSTKPANLIGGRKSGKPGVNKLGSWIEGRLTKFIAGEEDTEGPIKATPPTKGKGKDSSAAPVGPFSHFSTISPGPSNPVTRATSTADFTNGNGRASPPSHQPTSSSSSSTYGEQYNSGYGGYNPYSVEAEQDPTGEEDTPHALGPSGDTDDVELLNPMAALSLGPTRHTPTQDYAPPSKRVEEEEDEDDLGFGNTALSRNRTPKPADAPAEGDTKGKSTASAAAPAKPAAQDPSAAGKGDQKQSGWLRGWFGKKEGEGSGPIRAKLGEESSMIFDPELKRWIVKGAKPEPAAAAPPPPPPSRPQSAAPATSRAPSATPPPSLLSRSTGSSAAGGTSAGGLPPSSRTSNAGFTEMPDGGIRRQKSSLAESVTAPASGATPPPPGGGRPPLAGGPPKPPGSSIDDLLSRPPSKRPASAARKGVKNRYVDVFQGEGKP